MLGKMFRIFKKQLTRLGKTDLRGILFWSQVFKRNAWLRFSGGNILFKISKEKKMKKLLLVVALVAMFAGSAVAADWNFYGSARISTFWVNTDPGVNDVTQYEQALQGNSRIGAKVKVSDELTGRFEYGTGGGNANIRLLYGTWNFGAGSLTVGQDYAPLNWFYSNQVFDADADLLPYGGVYSGRVGQLRLNFGGFQVALVPTSVSTTGAAVTTEVQIPGIEATYSMTFDNITVDMGGGYQTYDVKNAAIDDNVASWVIALGAKAQFGAFYLGGNVYGGSNAGNLISVDTDANRAWNNGVAVIAANRVEDTDVIGGILVAGFALNDMFNFEVGYGTAKSDYDNAATQDDKVQSYYVNSTITMAPGVFVVPELGRIDGYENGQNDITYLGMKWQINF